MKGFNGIKILSQIRDIIKCDYEGHIEDEDYYNEDKLWSRYEECASYDTQNYMY